MISSPSETRSPALAACETTTPSDSTRSGDRTRFFRASASARAASPFSASVEACRSISRAPVSAASLSRAMMLPTTWPAATTLGDPKVCAFPERAPDLRPSP
jgi:hypothetical protein